MSDLQLAERWDEVRALVTARFGAWVAAEGWDIDDVLQELALKLWRSEQGNGAFRARQDGSGWAYWICLSCKRLLLNRKAKQVRRGRYQGHAYRLSQKEDGAVMESCDAADLAVQEFDETLHAIAMDARFEFYELRLWEME